MAIVKSDKRDQFIQTSAEILDAMANANRLAILSILIENEVSVGSLSLAIGLSQSALSQHLAKLRGAGLVTFRKDAQTVYYRCESQTVKSLLAMLVEIFPSGRTPMPQAA